MNSIQPEAGTGREAGDVQVLNAEATLCRGIRSFEQSNLTDAEHLGVAFGIDKNAGVFVHSDAGGIRQKAGGEHEAIESVAVSEMLVCDKTGNKAETVCHLQRIRGDDSVGHSSGDHFATDTGTAG